MANNNREREMKAVKDTVKYIELGLKSLNMKSTIEVEQESDTEFYINVPGIAISILVETDGSVRKGIGGREVRGPKWQVFSIKHLPATFDEPEDTDEIHRGDFTNVAECVAIMFELVVRDHIMNLIEATAYADDLAADHALAEEAGYHGLVRIK